MVTAARQLPGVPARASEGSLYFQLAVVAAAVAFLGFAPTYWAPMMAGKLKVDPIFHIHAVVFFGWAVFFAAQTWFATTRRIATHRSMGMVAISLATAMVIFGVMVAINRMHAAAAIGQKEAGLAFSIVPLAAISFFSVVFAAAVANVRRPDWHKRLMLIASLSILDAPIARWFIVLLAPDAPPGPPPVMVDLGPSLVALLLISVAMAADWRRLGHVHRAFWIAGGAYVLLKLLQVPLSTTPQWLATAEWLMGLAG